MSWFNDNLRFLRRKTSIILVAFMLGISNVILEEDRTTYNTRAKVEFQELQPDYYPLNSELSKEAI